MKVCRTCGESVEQANDTNKTWVHERIPYVDAFMLDADHKIEPINAPPLTPTPRPTDEQIAQARRDLGAT